MNQHARHRYWVSFNVVKTVLGSKTERTLWVLAEPDSLCRHPFKIA